MRPARSLKPLAAALACAAALAFAGQASAEPMDPALERLVLPSSVPCVVSTAAGPGTFSGLARCARDQASFLRLINQMGFAIAPTAMHSARTTGFGGFQFSLEGSYTSIDSSADYWQRGTQGAVDPNSQRHSVKNTGPDSSLGVYLLKIRKGFPFGLEVAANVGYLAHSSIVVGGADVRWSIVEGFRTGVPGIFPDLAVGAGVRTITGSPQLLLTVASIDTQISKPLVIADSSVLTPYLGYQYLHIYGDSGLIDTTPNTDPLGYCGYKGVDQPGTPGSGAKGAYVGQPVCGSGTVADFNNTFVFDPVRLNRHRIIMGVAYRYEVVAVSMQYMTDLVNPADANSGAAADALKDVGRQSTFAFDVGVAF